MQKETTQPALFYDLPIEDLSIEPAINSEPTSSQDRRRYRRILRFFAGVIGQFILLDLLLARLPIIGDRIRNSRTARLRRMARRFRALAVEMGGVLIKLGQFLSARVDVLPIEITQELAGLQDEVPAEPWPKIAAALHQELGDVSARFAMIEETPLAAASLGQAYRAQLLPAEGSLAVVLKVQRPGIEEIVRIDLDALRVVSRWIMRYGPIRRRANVPELMEEFAQTLWAELDYRAESDNAAHFAAIFADDDDVRVPEIYHQHSTGRVLTLENVEGLRIDNVDGIRAAGISLTQLSERLLDIYFKQVFQAGFFHADPHPGNIFVRAMPRTTTENLVENPVENSADMPVDESTPFQITFIDFGMMGNIQTVVSDNLQRLLLAVAKRDAAALTQIYSDMGFFLPSADLDRITEAQETVLARLWGRSLQEMARPSPDEIRELTNEFKDILRDFPFQVPQDFIYLGRAVGMLSGLTSQLYPDVNLWAQMEKYALEIIGKEGVKLFNLDFLRTEFQSLLAVPVQVRRLIQLAEGGRLQVRSVEDPKTARRLDQLERHVGRLNQTVLVAAGLLGGVWLYNAGNTNIAIGFWVVAGVLWWVGANGSDSH